MSQFSLSSLRLRMLLLVLFAVLPPLGLIVYSGLEQQRLATAQVQGNALRLVRMSASNQDQLIAETRRLLVILAQLNEVRRRDSAACNALFVNLLRDRPVYANLSALEPNGNVFSSAVPLKRRINLSDRGYFRRAVQTRDFAIGNYQIGRITGKATLNFGYPVLDDKGRLLAVVSAALDLAWLNDLTKQSELPQNSAMLVVDGNGTILARYPNPDLWIGKTIPEAPLIKAILNKNRGEKNEGTAETVGLDGVLRLYAFTRLREGRGASSIYVGVGIPKTVAFAESQRMLRRNLAALGMVILLALGAAWLGGNHIAAFILSKEGERQQAQEALRKAHGELEQRVQERTEDLSKVLLEIAEVVNVLGSSATEIVTSTTQLAATSTETASAVSETTATVEALRETSQLANEKATVVAENAQQAAAISQAGKRSTEATSTGMNRIQEQMELIKDSMLRLSEQGQAIGDIIASVDDLAQQSNLLAVNASIEAAKAGEQGKGFAVVAQEVKSLAEQSRQATTQVRNILNDIQKATGGAVMATEQGSKAVEAGVQQSAEAGESILRLAEGVGQAAQSATQIAASSQQQLVGMDQVALAMEHVKRASTQNVDSARQLEAAAQDLNQLGQRLKELANQHEV